MAAEDTETYIEAYLNDQLSPLEKERFEQRLQADPELAKQTEQYRLEQAAQEDLIRFALKERMNEWEAALPEAAAPAGNRWVSRQLLILTVLGGLILILAWFQWGRKVEETELQPAVTEPEVALQFYSDVELRKELLQRETRRGVLPNGASAETDALQQAETAYLDNDYRVAVSLLEKIPADLPNYWAGRELLAHAYFQLRQFDRSQRVFRSIAAQELTQYRDHAEWYGLLAQLAAGAQLNEVQTALKTLTADEGHAHYRELAALQAALNKGEID